MRRALLLGFILLQGLCWAQDSQSRPNLSLDRRLDIPVVVVPVRGKLTDLVSFVATTYKVPVLAEIVAPNPDISIPGGTYTARQLVDITVRAIPSYRWQNQDGVAHICQRRVVDARGNLLNLRIHRFMTPQNVRDFNMIFRACLKSTVQGFGCMGAVITEITPAFFEKEKLGIEIFKDRTAREVLLWALQDNGFCYVVLGYPNSRPKLPGDAEFTFVNWHLRSLRTQEPDPIWIQSPRN